MNKFKNWILPVLIILAGVLDELLNGLEQFAVEIGVDPKLATYVRLVAFIVASVILKLQVPSKNPEKLYDLAEKAEQKKAEEEMFGK